MSNSIEENKISSANITDARLGRLDQEVIDRYFSPQAKKDLEALITEARLKEILWWNDLIVKVSEIIGLPKVSKAERIKLATDMLKSANDRIESLKKKQGSR